MKPSIESFERDWKTAWEGDLIVKIGQIQKKGIINFVERKKRNGNRTFENMFV